VVAVSDREPGLAAPPHCFEKCDVLGNHVDEQAKEKIADIECNDTPRAAHEIEKCQYRPIE
jgi:hypothetical protein